MFLLLYRFSKPTINSCLDDFDEKSSEDMKVVIDDYFEKLTDDCSKPEINFYAQVFFVFNKVIYVIYNAIFLNSVI